MPESGNQKILHFASHHLPSPPHIPPPTLQSPSPADPIPHSHPETLDQSSANALFSQAVLLFHTYSWHESITQHRELVKRLSSSSTPVQTDPISPNHPQQPHEQEAWIISLISKLWFNIGIIQCHLGEYASAIEAFNHSVQINSDYVMAWFCLGMVFFEVGHFRKALRRFKQCWGFFRISVVEVKKTERDVTEGKNVTEEQRTGGPKTKTKMPVAKAKVKLGFEKDGLRYTLVREELEYNIRLCLLWKLHKQVNSERPPSEETLIELPPGILFEPVREYEVAIEEDVVEDDDEAVVAEESRTGRSPETPLSSRRYTIPRTTTSTTTPSVTILPSSVRGESSTNPPVRRRPTWSSLSPASTATPSPTTTTSEADPAAKDKKRDNLPLLKGLHFPKRLFQRRGTFPRHTGVASGREDEVTSGLPARGLASSGSNRSGLMRGHGIVPVRMRYISPSAPPSGYSASIQRWQQQQSGESSGSDTSTPRGGVIHKQEEEHDDEGDGRKGGDKPRIDSFALIAPEDTKMRIPLFKGKKTTSSRLGQLFKPLPPLPEQRASYPPSNGSSLALSQPNSSSWPEPSPTLIEASLASSGTTPSVYSRPLPPRPLIPGYSSRPAPASGHPPSTLPAPRYPPPPPPSSGYIPHLPPPPTAPPGPIITRKKVPLPLSTPLSPPSSSSSTTRPIFPPVSSVLNSLFTNDDDGEGHVNTKAINEAIEEEEEEGYDDDDDEEIISALGLDMGLLTTTITNVRSTNETFSPETYGYGGMYGYRPTRASSNVLPPSSYVGGGSGGGFVGRTTGVVNTSAARIPRTNITTTSNAIGNTRTITTATANATGIPRTTTNTAGFKTTGPYRSRSNTAPSIVTGRTTSAGNSFKRTPKDVECNTYDKEVEVELRQSPSIHLLNLDTDLDTTQALGRFTVSAPREDQHRRPRPRRRSTITGNVGSSITNQSPHTHIEEGEEEEEGEEKNQHPHFQAQAQAFTETHPSHPSHPSQLIDDQKSSLRTQPQPCPDAHHAIISEFAEVEEVEDEDEEGEEEERPRESYILARRASAFERLGVPRDDDERIHWPERGEMARVIWGLHPNPSSNPNANPNTNSNANPR